MVCRITSIDHGRRGFTLAEMMIAVGLGSMVLTAFMLFFWYANQGFTSLTNYLDLDQTTQVAMDKISREIRQANRLTDCSSNSLTFQNYDGGTLQYTFNSGPRTLTRTKNGTNSTTFLTGCDSVQFSIFQRTPATNSFQPLATAYATNAKVIELTWNCSRSILGSKVNTESMQSAKIVIRKK